MDWTDDVFAIVCPELIWPTAGQVSDKLATASRPRPHYGEKASE